MQEPFKLTGMQSVMDPLWLAPSILWLQTMPPPTDRSAGAHWGKVEAKVKFKGHW